jgi:alkylated DNA repair dioxygenase AlkB
MASANFDLFSNAPDGATPTGFSYSPDFIGPDEEADLSAKIRRLDFAPYEFRGVQARRRVVSFGLRHGYSGKPVEQAEVIPHFLDKLRAKAAVFAGIAQDEFKQVLVSEYTPGTPIGWHRDRPIYDAVVGISLLSEATFRFRLETERGWIRKFQHLEPRSIYLLRGPARYQWQHSIPAVPALRYSITFRTLREGDAQLA